jgi:pseudaminic acid cytidylyltransferase
MEKLGLNNKQVKSIAIIPARSNSKRIPKKNIKLFLGKPIIAYAIEAALNSRVFDEVIVSTDSIEIADIAKHYGASVPFLRSEKNADDFATTSEVLLEVIKKLNDNHIIVKNACCIYPTAVLVNEFHLEKAWQKFDKGQFDTIISAMRFSYPIQRGLKDCSGKLEMLWPENKTKRSQDLETIYHDAGQFYFFDVDKFRVNQQLLTDNTGYVLLSDYECQDIDNPEDWEMAEIKYNYLLRKKQNG